MDHADHVHLLRRGVPDAGGVWADLGAGGGAFTLALAELLGSAGTIYAVDRNGRSLRRLRRRMQNRFPGVALHLREADFTRSLDLPPLDGMVMANALHFAPDGEKAPLLRRLRGYLREGGEEENGRFLLVEYDTDRGNRWVPHPLSYETWAELAARCGFAHTERIATRPSSFLGRFYAAMSW
jgi:ubiquinone/menaquinone biosynthesis C-methylase UbiE